MFVCMDLQQVTLSQMRYAVAVAEALSFREAATRCGVSQSGLSMQVRKLEGLLAVRLFDRSKKPVRITSGGEIALSQMRVVLRETERLGQKVAEDVEPSGRYRFGVIPSLSPTVLPLFLAEFSAAHPRVSLIVEELKTEEIIARLRQDTLDAGLAATPLEIPGLSEEVLGHEAMYAYLPPGDPLLADEEVPQASLRERELWVMPEGHCFRSQVLSYCNRGTPDGSRRIHFESGSFQTLVGLVDQGLGATVLPALVADNLRDASQRVRVRPLTAPRPVREIGLVTARTDLRRRVSVALADVIRRRLTEALDPAANSGVTLSPYLR
ncbi:MAG: LysR family hydrogen peroxide-inducible transcriptional activator [Myxococcota bacterium]|jgi:LysR family hydrogen peroxide-inducible transcriptional activator